MLRYLPATATNLVCVGGQDCWLGFFVAFHPVPRPNAHIQGRTGVPVVAGSFARARDSVLKWKLQSANRRVAPQPGSRNRIARERQPRCTECGGTALREIRTHSAHATTLPRPRARRCPNPLEQSCALRE